MKEVREILEERRRLNEIQLNNRREEVYNLEPRIKDLEKSIKQMNIQRISMALKGDPVDQITEDIDGLTREFENILQDKGYPKDYLQLKYHCDKCKDTGADGAKICSCKRQLMAQKLYENTGISHLLERENFKNFNLDLFRKSRQDGEVMSPYDNMKETREELYEYSTNFDKDSANLYLYGNVGTGKTYLLNSIAKEVLDRGHSVVYLTETDLANVILEARFAYSETRKENKARLDTVMESDLLIIDDLGSNNINEVTKSAIFEAINSRMVKRLPVIISSNLDPEDIRRTYDTRIYSRIVGSFFVKHIFGSDIRMSL